MHRMDADNLKNIDAKTVFTPEEIAFINKFFDTEEIRNSPHAEDYYGPGISFSDRVFIFASGIAEDYNRYKKGVGPKLTDEEKALLNDPLAESIAKKFNAIAYSLFPGTENTKQLTLKRIKNIEDTYFTKADADTLKLEITGTDGVAKTDTILVSQGEIKLFENIEAFESYKQKIESTFDIKLYESVDYEILADNYYLRTGYSNGGDKGGSNLITESNLPRKIYTISHSVSNVIDITTGQPGMRNPMEGPHPLWYWFRVNADQANTRINVYKRDWNENIGMGATDRTSFQINQTNSQTEFQPKYLNIFAVKFLKTLTYKTFFINATKEQNETFRAFLPIVQGALKDFIIKAEVKPKILYIKGQQYVFSDRQSFDDVLDNLQTVVFSGDAPDMSDAHLQINQAILADFEIKTIENSSEIKIIPKKDIYYKLN